jgi:hypothetical protein
MREHLKRCQYGRKNKEREKEKQYEGKLAPKNVVYVRFLLSAVCGALLSSFCWVNVCKNSKSGLNRFKIARFYFLLK